MNIFVLYGTQEDARGRYPAETLVVHPPGSGYEVQSPQGCMVLVSWDCPVVFAANE